MVSYQANSKAVSSWCSSSMAGQCYHLCTYSHSSSRFQQQGLLVSLCSTFSLVRSIFLTHRFNRFKVIMHDLVLLGMATLITVVILQIPELQLVEVAEVLDWIFMVLPNYSLGMAFNNLYTNSRAVEYCTRPIVVFACKTGLRPNPCCKSM